MTYFVSSFGEKWNKKRHLSRAFFVVTIMSDNGAVGDDKCQEIRKFEQFIRVCWLFGVLKTVFEFSSDAVFDEISYIVQKESYMVFASLQHLSPFFLTIDQSGLIIVSNNIIILKLSWFCSVELCRGVSIVCSEVYFAARNAQYTFYFLTSIQQNIDKSSLTVR